MTDGHRELEARRFRVLATCPSFEPGFRGGGPVRSVAGIVDTISHRVEVSLVTCDRDLGSSEPYPGLSGRWVRRSRSRVFYLNTHRPQMWWRLLRELRAVRFDLLYVNSLWQPVFTVIPVLAVRLRVVHARKILLAPRGELSPGALALKPRRKRLFLAWWGRCLASVDVLWHASTDAEASDIRRLFPAARIHVSLNTVSLPEEPLPVTGGEDRPARMVFIGRISPKKNLDLAICALRSLSKPVEFDIYGPLEDPRYWSRCRSLMSRLPDGVRVEYRGELTPAQVRRTFGCYDAFVFPTAGENFGHVIAESLSASCPVICSDQTPWTHVLETGGGAVVRDLTAAHLGGVLEHLATMPALERLEARRAAGNAYRLWRRGLGSVNVLDETRLTP
jgi:glycosyltransferase involved in cell wall biosynthesis